MDPDIVIRTDNLSKRFEKSYAVRAVSLEVQKGTIFGFMGPSGSGKTTTIRMLTGGYEPTSGKIDVLGEAPSAFSLQTRARIGYMPQLFALYPDLTIWENLNFAASIYGVGLRRRKRLREILDFVELTDHTRKPVRKISGGMRRRLSLAAALIHDPDLFFLDEPTTGLDPVLRQKFWQHFHALKDAGKTLFVTTQYVNEAANCDQVGILVEGELLALDTPEHLRQKALGGDIVTLETAAPLPREFDSELEALPWVVGVPVWGRFISGSRRNRRDAPSLC